MADHEPSIVDLIKTSIRDAQALVQAEVALAKAELYGEVSRLSMGVGLLAGAALFGLIALLLLMMTLAFALASAFGWPVWIGFAIVTALMLLGTAVLALIGRGRLAAGRRMPKTVDTLKENAEWIRARTP